MTDLFDAMTDTLDDAAGDDTLDAQGVHGALTAWAVTGKATLPPAFTEHVFGEDAATLDPEVKVELSAQWATLLNDILSGLYDDVELYLPFDSTLDWENSEQHAWCLGFMEMLFAHENAFGHVREDALAELLLPIQVGSGLFITEPEFKEIYHDEALLGSLLQQIPDVLVDIYLLCNVPE
ncbi:MAG: YecA family protein [Natronospirillum sp.]